MKQNTALMQKAIQIHSGNYIYASKELQQKVRGGDTRARSLLQQAALSSHRVVSAKAKHMVTHFLKEMREVAPFRGKAMVVCRSRASVLEFCTELRRQIAKVRRKFKKKHGRCMMKFPVYGAFSGELENVVMVSTEKRREVDDDDEKAEEEGGGVQEQGEKVQRKTMVNETILNRGVPFENARLLVVCNKLETGYDDPLLSSMYVDRSLRGAHAVQVLSRLNRRSPGKNRVSVVDYVNSPATLHAAFASFWDATSIDAGEAPRLYHSPRADSIVDQVLSLLREHSGRRDEEKNARTNTTETTETTAVGGGIQEETRIILSIVTILPILIIFPVSVLISNVMMPFTFNKKYNIEIFETWVGRLITLGLL